MWSRHMLILHFPIRAALLLYVRQISVLLASPQMCNFCHLIEKGLTTISSTDSPQILCRGSVITLFYKRLKLLFHHGDLMCEMFLKHARVSPVRFIKIRGETKQNASINFMHVHFYFFWTKINWAKLNCMSVHGVNSFFRFLSIF